MATVSARVDDGLKNSAEDIANRIGIPLGTAVNIFLKRFVANNGFPFDVVDPTQKTPVIDFSLLDTSVKKAVADKNNVGLSNRFTYLDPETNKLIKVQEKE